MLFSSNWSRSETQELLEIAENSSPDWDSIAEKLKGPFSAKVSNHTCSDHFQCWYGNNYWQDCELRYESILKTLESKVSDLFSKRQLKYNSAGDIGDNSRPGTPAPIALTERQQIALLTKQSAYSPASSDSEVAPIDEVIDSESPCTEAVVKPVKKKKTKSRDKRKKVSVWLPSDFDSWVPGRKKAWQQVHKDPNTYYFKYPKPGMATLQSYIGYWEPFAYFLMS